LRKQKYVKDILGTMRDDAQLMFSTKEEMGLYFNIIEGLKQ
jgi:hypothetical protein